MSTEPADMHTKDNRDIDDLCRETWIVKWFIPSAFLQNGYGSHPHTMTTQRLPVIYPLKALSWLLTPYNLLLFVTGYHVIRT
jgi:hypothetical protein